RVLGAPMKVALDFVDSVKDGIEAVSNQGAASFKVGCQVAFNPSEAAGAAGLGLRTGVYACFDADLAPRETLDWRDGKLWVTGGTASGSIEANYIVLAVQRAAQRDSLAKFRDLSALAQDVLTVAARHGLDNEEYRDTLAAFKIGVDRSPDITVGDQRG